MKILPFPRVLLGIIVFGSKLTFLGVTPLNGTYGRYIQHGGSVAGGPFTKWALLPHEEQSGGSQEKEVLQNNNSVPLFNIDILNNYVL